MTTSHNSKASSGSVKTYRGRTIEEILPQIRSELGPDAVILREREGLVGGVGGFFAQRLIEVDARRADGQSIDIYDDAGSEEQADSGGLLEDPETREQPEPFPVSEPDGHGGDPLAEILKASDSAAAPAPSHSPSPAPATPPASRSFETGLFLDRLREASQALPDDDELAPAKPPVDESAEVVAVDDAEVSSPDPEPEPGQESTGRPTPRRSASARDRQARRQARTRPARPPASEEQAEVEEPEAPDAPEERPRPTRRSSERRRRRTETEDVGDARDGAVQPPPANPYESVRPRPPIPVDDGSASGPRQRPRTPVPAAFATPRTSPRSRAEAAPAEQRRPAQGRAGQPAAQEPAPAREQRRGAFGRLIDGWRRPAPPPRPTPAKRTDLTEVHEAVQFLVARGASEAWASQLIGAAAAHGAPLAQGLHEAAQAEVARRILAAPALPVTGAAIAFIGAGGSGKTRCTAALASAYDRASTLPVTVIAIDDPNGANQLRQLLDGTQVRVLSQTPGQARRTIDTGRENGLVIVDTPTCTPTDPDAVATLASQLSGLGLDAVYVALPATLGAQAARRALSSFAALHPTAVAITHADETDQLAVVVEIATTHRIPLAYVHAGTNPHTALTPVQPGNIARHLIP